jgi:glycosyltransferase involved in cell wall biosynthesis
MSNFQGWILDALAKESAMAIHAPININYIPVSRREIRSLNALKAKYFPKANGNNLFFHHRTFLEVNKRVSLEGARNRVMLTHFDDVNQSRELLMRSSLISKLFVMNNSLREALLGAGFPVDKLQVTPGAVDRNLFFPSSSSYSKDSYFLFSGDCKPRKNPSYVEWIILSFPEYRFVIHGKGWRAFNHGSLARLPNLEIVDFSFSKQGGIHRGASALISVADNEGGPMAILEALASGTPVIATNTGFAKDLITHENGFIISEDLDREGWRNRLVELLKMKDAVYNKDLLEGKFTWSKLGADFYL